MPGLFFQNALLFFSNPSLKGTNLPEQNLNLHAHLYLWKVLKVKGKRIKHILNCHAFNLQEAGAVGVQLGESHTRSSQHINTRGTATSHILQEKGPVWGAVQIF